MPLPIKKFKLRYSQLPQVFQLDPEMFLSAEADAIPTDDLARSDKQNQQVQLCIDQIEKDENRTAYVDFTGLTVSSLKMQWVVTNPDGKRVLMKGVYPLYTQGNNTGASVGEIIHAMQFAVPLSEKDMPSFETLMEDTTTLCFSYRTDQGEPAGFSLVAAPRGDVNGQHQGFILSTIQRTTAHPTKRSVTVLASPEYTTSKPNRTVMMNSAQRIEDELYAAIQNRKITTLIKRIFDQEGNINPTALAELVKRIQINRNIDDRDRKNARLNALIRWAESINDHQLNIILEGIKHERSINIDFFKEGVFEPHLTHLTNSLALALKNKLIATQTTKNIATILTDVSSRCAELEMLAEAAYKDTEKKHTYQQLAAYLFDQALTFQFNNTAEDNKKIILISQCDLSQIKENVGQLYTTNPSVRAFYALKNECNEAMDRKLKTIAPPDKTSFIQRHRQAIGLSFSILLLVGLGIILTGALTPIGVASIAVGVAVFFWIGGKIHHTERLRTETLKQRADAIHEIKTAHAKRVLKAEQAMQEGIPLASLFDPKPPAFISKIKVDRSHPLTAARVAHALWLQDQGATTTSRDKHRFSLWATKVGTLGFGVKEVDAIIEERYEMQP